MLTILKESPKLNSLTREHVAGLLASFGERFDAQAVDRLHAAMVVARAEAWGPERLDANETMILANALKYLSARVADVERPPTKGRLFVPVTHDVPAGATSWSYTQYDRVGMAKVITNKTTDLPSVTAFGKEFVARIFSLGLKYTYTRQDLRAAALTGLSLPTKLQKLLREGFEQKVEEVAAIGITETGETGLLNNASVPAYTAAAAAAGANAPAWDGADKTALEILADLQAPYDAVITTTLGTHKPDTCILPLTHLRIIQTRPLSTAAGSDPKDTILKVFQDRNPGVSFDFWAPCDTAGASGTQRGIMYQRNPLFVHLEIPQEVQEEPVQARGLAFEVPAEQRIGGVVFEYPLSAIYLNSI